MSTDRGRRRHSIAKSFNQCGHRLGCDFARLLSKLTVKVSMIVSVDAALVDFSSWRAVKEAGGGAAMRQKQIALRALRRFQRQNRCA